MNLVNSTYYPNGNPLFELYHLIDNENDSNILTIEYYENGNFRIKEYFLNGKRNRKNEPALIMYYEDSKIYFEQYCQNDLIHNNNGPAIITYLNNYKVEKYYINNNYLELVKSNEELQRYIKLNNIS